MQASATAFSSYPGFGYPQHPQQGYFSHQQGYVMYQQGQCPNNSYHSKVLGTQVAPNPYITTSPPPYNHHMMAQGGYNHQQEGSWNDKNKYQNGWHGYYSNDAVAYGGGYNHQQDGTWNDKNKHQNGWTGNNGYGSNYHEACVPGVPIIVQAGGYGHGSTWGSGNPSQGYPESAVLGC